MKATIILIAVLFSFSGRLNGQTRTMYGRVIADDLLPIWGVRIQNTNRLTLGVTDSTGRFKIDISQNTQTLFFNWIGLEQATIKLTAGCDTLEIVMLPSGTYDFTSPRKIDKDRLRIFRTLPELYSQAYKRGFFKKDAPCYSREFEPRKPALDSITKEMVKKQKQIKLTFEKLKAGDTVRIPFGTEYRYDGTDRTTLRCYAFFASKNKYDCIVEGIIVEKNKHKRAYNLVYKVTNIKLDKYPAVFQSREVKVGDVFTYNIRIYKILNE